MVCPAPNVVLDHLMCPCRLGWKVRKNLERYLESNYIYLCVCMLSHIWLFATPWIIACQGSSVRGITEARILEWVAFPSSGDLPNPGIKPESPALQMDFLLLSHWGSPQLYILLLINCKSCVILRQSQIHEKHWNIPLNIRAFWGRRKTHFS